MELTLDNPVEKFASDAHVARLRRGRVVIVGGGFGGLSTARALRRVHVDVALVDRRNFHLFQPLLYQVATGGLSPANIAAPLRSLLRRQKNVDVHLAEVVDVNPLQKFVEIRSVEPGELLPQTARLSYDWLVVAAGAGHSYFGHAEWQQLRTGLKTLEDATEMRRRIFSAFEAAEHEKNSRQRRALMTFVVVGGGPTGVELAGAISELARHTLRNDFRNINPSDTHIILVDAQDRMLSGFAPVLSRKAEMSLERLGIELLRQTTVNGIHTDSVTLSTDQQQRVIPTRTVLWAAGVAGVPLGQSLARVTGVQLDRAGRIPVEPDLTIAGHPNVFVIGDLAHCPGEHGQLLPGVAPVAMQQGRYVGRLIAAQVRGRTPPAAFKYRDRGSMATIGRKSAVAELGFLRLGGLSAWLMWSLVHILSIAQLENRMLVFFQWIWNYLTFNRSARLITETVRTQGPASRATDRQPPP